MNVSEHIFHVVAQYSDTVFFVSGGGSMFLVDALGRSKLKKVPMLHEQGAGFAAIGYAQASRGLGVVLTTSGPGVTNAITPCLAAWMDSVPVLFISGAPNSDTLIGDTGLRSRGVQEADTIALVSPITKMAKRLLDINDLDINDMIIFALSGRKGPVWLEVPLDQQSKEFYG